MSAPAADNLRQLTDVLPTERRPILAAADLLDAIDALPDDSPFDPAFTTSYLHGYREAMRRVKRLLHLEATDE